MTAYGNAWFKAHNKRLAKERAERLLRRTVTLKKLRFLTVRWQFRRPRRLVFPDKEGNYK